MVGTGRSDYPNQINNVLAFPGIFRGALNVRARRIKGLEAENVAMEETMRAGLLGLPQVPDGVRQP